MFWSKRLDEFWYDKYCHVCAWKFRSLATDLSKFTTEYTLDACLKSVRFSVEYMSRKYFSTHEPKVTQILGSWSVFLDIALKNTLEFWSFLNIAVVLYVILLFVVIHSTLYIWF